MPRHARKADPQSAAPSTGSQRPDGTSPAGRRPLTDDERIDEAGEESMGTSDPPAHGSPTRIGAPPKRKQKKRKNPA